MAKTAVHYDRSSELAPTPMDAHVGARIRQRRMQMGWAMEKLADEIGVARSTLQALEAGSRRVQVGRLLDIGNQLKIAPSWFLEEFPIAGVPTNKDNLHGTFMKSRRAIAMVEAFVRLPLAQQTALVTLATGLAEHAPPAPDGEVDEG